MSIDDVDRTNEPLPPITKSTGNTKLKSKKPSFIWDLIKTQIQKDNQSRIPEKKKWKLTEVGDRCVYPYI